MSSLESQLSNKPKTRLLTAFKLILFYLQSLQTTFAQCVRLFLIFDHKPERHPALLVRKLKPFNAEAPIEFLIENYITPNELWYCRHHHPVPVVDPSTFKLQIKNQTNSKKGDTSSGDGSKMLFNNMKDLSLKDIKNNYKKAIVTATMQCGGNRRGTLNANGKTQGLTWDVGAIR